MEIKLGRKLKEDEVVHHIDNNKQNNDVGNLIVMNKREHLSLHNAGVPKPKPIGWKPKNTLSVKKVNMIKKLLLDGLNNSEIARKIKVSDYTVGRYKKKFEEFKK